MQHDPDPQGSPRRNDPRPPPAAAHDDPRFTALEARAAEADGLFVYAVRTTGVFCRPSCPSRKPLRRNVELFDTAGAAARAGYRACKRCRPDDGALETSTSALVRACRQLSATEPARTRDVAAAVGLSEGYLTRCFKRALGVTPQQYRRRAQAERARQSLGSSPSIAASAFAAGYGSSSRFYEGVGRELGMSPAQAAAGAPGEDIAHAVVPCSLGHLLIAWTARGVCQVGLADRPEGLRADLERRFPRASHRTADPGPWAQGVAQAVERSEPADVPLDIRGTAFQERVWQALRRIPPGETRTYGELARSLSTPRGARAVAGACAGNPLAVVVPCHRVVGQDGSLRGYRWGEQRKRALLQREARE